MEDKQECVDVGASAPPSMTSEGYIPRPRTFSEHASNDLPNPAPRTNWIHPTLVIRARVFRLAAHVVATAYLFRSLARAKLIVLLRAPDPPDGLPLRALEMQAACLRPGPNDSSLACGIVI